ncbi:hypothetical protein EIP91_003393 [Steccherinum ochraceum]|uniref:F-box domain-containing protein n=1 Tax=Steccherinum ochraceum TaxID=92696 RepID=A0A4R0RAL0_9APHY|nr:hypothetical protein EIP91_003393 [Steccherinum ochraceum]
MYPPSQEPAQLFTNTGYRAWPEDTSHAATPQTPQLELEDFVPALRAVLTLDRRTYDEVERLLHSVLSLALHLQVLRIRNARAFIFTCAGISSHIASLTTLRILELSGICKEDIRLLCDIRSPLTKLTLQFGDHIFDEDLYGSEWQLWPIVFKFVDTLVELAVLNVPVRIAIAHDASQLSFPQVRTLSLCVGSVESWNIGKLPRMFPNIEDLRLDVCTGGLGRFVPRLAINDAQNRGGLPRTWASLTRLSCPVWMGDIVPSGGADVWHGLRLGQEGDDLRHFHATLAGMQPRYLDIEIFVFHFLQHSRQRFSDVFCPADVRHLNIDLVDYAALSPHGIHTAAPFIFDAFTDCLPNLSLEFLSLRLQVGEPRNPGERKRMLGTYLPHMDVPSYVVQLANAIPTLVYVFVKFELHQQEDVLWKVTRHDGRLPCVAPVREAERKLTLEMSPFASKLL